MRRKPVELAVSRNAKDTLPQTRGAVQISQKRDRVSLPKEWIDALRREGIPLVVFMNQASAAEGSYEKILEVTKKVKELYAKVVKKINKTHERGVLKWLFGSTDLHNEAASAIRYYQELEQTGELPNKCINPPSWKAQLEISDIIVDTLNGEFKIVDPNHDIMYDMHHGTKGIANCLIMCLYYVTIARRLGMNAELYVMPMHTIVGLHSYKKTQLIDPAMNLKRAEMGVHTFKTKGGEFTVDYRKIRSTDCYGLAGAWESKGDVCVNKGDGQTKKGDLEKALKTYETAIDAYENAATIDPRKLTAILMLMNKGQALVKIGEIETQKGNKGKARENYAKAIKECEKALRIEPNFTPAKYAKESAEEKISQLG